ncbi:ribonuclease 2-5A-domain-containing protein [Mycena galopus ATCC 62051]|nr:ribonuclease 2-5A-domain-containing protein [Mycena galopus ATCC 62051]
MFSFSGRWGRAVAVKCLPQDSVTVASSEVGILQDSDGHSNVIRYYYQEAHSDFLYNALELCPATLADIIETPDRDAWRDISVAFDPKRALRQITSGLRYLHNLDLIHRDLKPLDGVVKDDVSVSSHGSVGASGATPGMSTPPTTSVNSFALGCSFFYTLTNGEHPFGDPFDREANILKGALQELGRAGEEGGRRPDTTTCLLHPFFWDSRERLNFLHDGSDRFEIMSRRPKDPYLLALEKGSLGVVGNDWLSRLDPVFLENLGKFRKFDGRSVQDLLRALRNKKHQYEGLPDKVKRTLGRTPDGFLAYFTRQFPRLLLHVHSVVGDTLLRSELIFRSYFELQD